MTVRYRTQIGGLAVDAQFLETAEDELDYALKSAPRGPHLPPRGVCWHLIIVIVNKEYLSIITDS